MGYRAIRSLRPVQVFALQRKRLLSRGVLAPQAARIPLQPKGK
jgi:hypothetical protein